MYIQVYIYIFNIIFFFVVQCKQVTPYIYSSSSSCATFKHWDVQQTYILGSQYLEGNQFIFALLKKKKVVYCIGSLFELSVGKLLVPVI